MISLKQSCFRTFDTSSTLMFETQIHDYSNINLSTSLTLQIIVKFKVKIHFFLLTLLANVFNKCGLHLRGFIILRHCVGGWAPNIIN